MTDQLTVDNLQALIEEHGEEYGLVGVQTFRKKMLLTKNMGVVIEDENGEEHQFSLNGSWDENV